MAIEPDYSKEVFGIDLGTCNSAIALCRSGHTNVIPVEGELTFPSVVSITPDGKILCGQRARNRALVDPENTVSCIKREMGGPWTKEFPNNKGVTYTPVRISAEILNSLVSLAENCTDPDIGGRPYDVVLCVPSNLRANERDAVAEAAKEAGLNVLEFLEEPVAAAIAYAMDRESDQTVLVYDLGGGTFDVSVLEVDSSKRGSAALKVLGTRGIQRLGGEDFDWRLMELAAEELKKISHVDILDLKKDQGIKAKLLREAQQRLKETCERTKLMLTEAESAPIVVPEIIKDESGTVYNLDMEVTREQFEAAIIDLVDQTKEAITQVLADAKLTMEDISRILLVGGSSKVPLIKRALTEMYGKEPWADLNPDTVVARGAAMYAAGLRGLMPKTVHLQTIVTHYLGIETVHNEFSCLIEKGAEIPEDIPLTASETYSPALDNMTEITIRVYQANDKVKFAGDPGSTSIGEFTLSGIPPKPRGEEQIVVSFAINRANMLTISAKSSTSEQNLEIRRSAA